MNYTTMVYKAPSGQWSWSVLDPNNTPIAGGGGYASESAAEADADAELSTYLVDDELDADPHAGLRADGELLTGYDAIDNDPAIVHPGNVNPDGTLIPER